MFKNKKLLLTVGIIALVVCIGVVLGLLALRVGAGGGSGQESGETATYTIEVKSAAGIGLKEVGLYIYEDSTLAELVSFLKTDENGTAAFTDVKRDTYVAVPDKVPTGYEAEAYYPITGELTEIVLQTGKMEDADVEDLTYKLGDAVMDFSVTGPDGTVYTLSELFKGKQAVVLNFFYNACQPCMLEFPFLQEAYAEYSDSIAVLAMNPVDGDDAAVAALQKELGITFPMVKCGPEWESIMQLSAYPTTVIIDRFGNICLIHRGSVTDAKTFKDAFAYFSAEEYEQKLIEDIKDLEIEEPEGSKENPTEVGGQNSFEVTVEPGQVFYYDLYKVFNMYLQIGNENAYVIYNDETYYPKNGVVGLMVSAPDTFTPAKIGIGNSGTEKATFTVYLSALKGSFGNPYTLTLGQFDVNVAAGNEQGVYYTYTPTEDGTLTLQCLSVSGGVKYGYFLFNTVTSAMRNLDSDSSTDETGAVTVSVTAKKGQKIQICISTLPDSNHSYPAASFKFNATFTAGEVADQVIEKKTAYTVKVLDDQNQPMPNVSVVVDVAGEKTGFATGKDGVANISLTPGSYKGEIYVPDGYTADKTTFEITEAAPDVSLILNRIKQARYTVKVVGPQGEAVENVFVKIGSGTWLRTDASGTVSEELDLGAYTVTVMVPDGYSGETAYTFAEGATELTVTLGYPLGSEQNPCSVEEYPFITGNLSGGQEIYCSFAYAADMVGISIEDPDAYIRCGETTYGADGNGVVNFTFDPEGQSPVLLILGNGGTDRESYTVRAIYAPGSQENPYVVEAYPYSTRTVAADAAYYYSFPVNKKVTGFTISDADAYIRCGETVYTADASGVVSFTFDENAQTGTVLVIGNSGTQEKTFTLEAVLPLVGSLNNPFVPANLGTWAVLKLEEGDTDGYYYAYTTEKTGTLTVRLMQTLSVAHDIELTTDNRRSLLSSDGANRQVTIDMEAGQTVLIHVYMLADEQTGIIPAASVRLRTSFVEQQIGEPPVTEPPTTEPTQPTEPEATEPSGPAEGQYTYSVTVTDIFGAGQSGVGVMFLKDGAPVSVVYTGTSGVAEMYTEDLTDYTVELVFTGKEYYYDKTAAVLTADSRSLTVKLIANVDETDYSAIYILQGNPAYTLYTGGTRVQIGSGKPNFSAEYGNNCFFVFTPQTAGTYQITATPDVPLSYWGVTTFISEQSDMVEDNTITFSISGTTVKNTTFVIGVKVDGSVEDVVLNVARVGEPEFSIADQPWSEWKTGLTHTDAWKSEVGLVAVGGGAYYTLSTTPTYVDIKAASGTYDLYYDEANGYYRMGQNGPIILVDLNAQNRFVPLYERVNGNGQYGGSAVTRYFFETTGEFVRREDYTEYLVQCFDCVNLNTIKETGYHPLTKDLMYALQNGFCQWWDPTSPNYLEGFATANEEYAWMFACCYVP